MPGNVKNWQVFENDTQINNFLTLKEEFTSTKMDTNTIEESNQMDKVETHISAETTNQILHPTNFTKTDLQQLQEKEREEAIAAECEVIELKDNFLPTGLTPLEDIFDSNDISRKPKMQPLNAEIKDCNLGTAENPKTIKLSKALPPDQKPKYIKLFK